MAGLDLGGGASIRTGSQSRYGNAPAPTTASGAAYGTSQDIANPTSALAPTNGTGLAFWVGFLGVAGMAFIYYSLPGG